MRKHTKRFLSAVVSAALCTACLPLQAVNSKIVIDHDCSGIDKGYYFEISNNDKDSQPEFLISSGGEYCCKWDNDEDFSALRGQRFASPVKFSELGAFNIRHFRLMEFEKFNDITGYVRFGIRLYNTKGDTFTIMETDASADGKSIAEKDKSYKKIGSLASKEAFDDYSWGNELEGDIRDVAYTIYSRENGDKKSHDFLLRRDEPIALDCEEDNLRRININDKMDAITEAGFDIGDITGYDLFLECSCSKGEATIWPYSVYIENMPEIAPDKYEDPSAPINVKNYESGVRTGYYYDISDCNMKADMEVIEPSLFKVEWDSSENNEYMRDTYFERGKSYEVGQSYRAFNDSDIEFTMNFSAEGSFAVNTAAKTKSFELPEYDLTTEFYIMDACQNWKFTEYAKDMGELSAEGQTYEVYEDSVMMYGSFAPQFTRKFYFVNSNAEENGKKGTVTVKHNLAPYVEFLRDNDVVFGQPDVLVAQLNGDRSKGTAELVENKVELAGYIADDGEFEKETRRIELNKFNNDTFIKGQNYWIIDNSRDISVNGFAGEQIKCEWKRYDTPVFSSSDHEDPSSFNIGLWRISNEIDSEKTLTVDYDITMGDINDIKDSANWWTGAYIKSYNDEKMYSDEDTDDYDGCIINIVDKWDGELTGSTFAYRDPQQVGVIESNGVKYDVILVLPEVRKDNTKIVYLKRQKQLEHAAGDENRYVCNMDAGDIVRKLNGLGIDTYDIWYAYFTLQFFGNEGSAVINKAEVRKIRREMDVFTADDLKKLSDFVLGNKADIPSGTDYDINGDGVWDIYDLCLMRKEVVRNSTLDYVEPEKRVDFGTTYDVMGDGVKLYRGPSEKYEVIAAVPSLTQLVELGYQDENSSWFFTEYDGHSGWVNTLDKNLWAYTGSQWGKPVIYLYPEEETDVHVELELTSSELSTTYPKYNNGWDVTAYPGGSLLNKADGTHHRYLFWESVNGSTGFDLSKGFCVAGSDTESFLREKLTYMGLTEEEMNEFIVYWLPRMEHNAYNLITFQGDLYTDAAKLDITPAPDSLLRVFMVYLPLENAVSIEPQQLVTFERKGFTVVEWGGTEIDA